MSFTVDGGIANEKGEFFRLKRPDYDALFVDLSDDEKKLLMQTFEKIGERLIEQIDVEIADDFY